MADRPQQPVLGLILFGGSLSGALVRDVRLANELVGRGYTVHAWWVMDQPKASPLDDRVHEHLLFHGFRYYRRPRWLFEQVGRAMRWYWSDHKRARSLQKRPQVGERIMQQYMRRVAAGGTGDRAVLDRFVRQVREAGVTHLLPMLSMFGMYALAAGDRLGDVRQLITFQGYELYVNYARTAGVEQQVYATLRAAAEASPWPAIAVSEDYAQRVTDELGVRRDRLVAIPPGVPAHRRIDRAAAEATLAKRLKKYDPDLPLVSYLGRQDVEKGIDLLLYAARQLQREGRRFQLAICGPTLFSERYCAVIRQLARDLRLRVIFQRHVDDALRDALLGGSRCVVYPSIHREPFGMVAAEAASFATPAVVPDYSGVAAAISAEGRDAGLRFAVWDSGDLARQIARLLDDDTLWQRLSDAGPHVAAYYAIERMADRVLAHLGHDPRP